LAYDVVIADAVSLAPGAHDIGVVVGYNADNIDTLCAKLWKLFYILGNVTSGADWCEGTRKSKEDDLLLGPLPGGAIVDGVPATRNASSLRGVRNISARSWLSV
jgi:hypothetical protein